MILDFAQPRWLFLFAALLPLAVLLRPGPTAALTMAASDEGFGRSTGRSWLQWVPLLLRLGSFAALIAALAAEQQEHDLFLANHVLGQLSRVVDQNERLRMLKTLHPVFLRQAAVTQAQRRWQQLRASCLRSLGRTAEAQTLQRQLATSAP